MKTVKILSLTLLMSIFCVGMSFARHGQKGQESKATSEERASKQVEMMKESLDLTPEQVTKLQAVQAQFAKDREQTREKNHQDMKTQKDAYDAQLKSILTPEQYQKYQSQHKNMEKDGKKSKNDRSGDKQAKRDKDGNQGQDRGNKKK